MGYPEKYLRNEEIFRRAEMGGICVFSRRKIQSQYQQNLADLQLCR